MLPERVAQDEPLTVTHGKEVVLDAVAKSPLEGVVVVTVTPEPMAMSRPTLILFPPLNPRVRLPRFTVSVPPLPAARLRWLMPNPTSVEPKLGFGETPLKLWELAVPALPWMDRVAEPAALAGAPYEMGAPRFNRLLALMMSEVGAPAALKSSARVPLVTSVNPV